MRAVGKPWPLPEALDGRPWVIVPRNGGLTDIVNGVMNVTLQNDAVGLDTRRHEIAHVKWSRKKPPRLKGVHPVLIQGAEDARLNILLSRAGLPPSREMGVYLLTDPMGALAMHKAGRLGDADLIAFLAANHRCCFMEQVFAAASEAQPDSASLVEGVREVLRRWNNGFKGRIPQKASTKLAIELQELLNAGIDGQSSGVVKDWGEGEARWLEPVISKLRMTEPTERMSVRRVRPTERGTAIRFPHRMLVDGAIFGQKVRRKVNATPTILLDGSGSMGLPNLDTVVAAFPDAKIAIYGTQHEAPAETAAFIVIAAEKGMRAKAITLPGGRRAYLNGCDLPALRWLKKQSGPHVWVSDGKTTKACVEGGKVSGHEVSVNPAITDHYAAARGIKRVRHFEDVADVLKQMMR